MITALEFEVATGITGKDEQVEILIPIVEQHLKAYCNIREIPIDYDLNVIAMIKHQLNANIGVKSETLSRHSITYMDDYPPEVLRGLRRRLRW